MLGRIWDFEDPVSGEVVHNVEGLCRRVLDRNLPKLGLGGLSDVDFDELLAHLLGEVVRVAPSYRPIHASQSLGGYLSYKLPLLLIDYVGSRYGRHGEKRVADLAGAGAVARPHSFADHDDGAVEQADTSVWGDTEGLAVARASLGDLLHAA